MNNLLHLLSKYQKHLLGLAIFLALFAVSFSTKKGETKQLFQNSPVTMFLLVAVSIILVAIYIVMDKNKIESLANKIAELSKEKANDIHKHLEKLTPQQKRVYDLIITGKSNKEIMSDLYIEQSTLKSHINQIYKKLQIKNRKELKSSLKS